METNSYSSVPLNTTTVGSAIKRTTFLRRHRGLLLALLSVLLLLFSLTMAFHAYIAWTLARPHIDPLRSNPAIAFGAAYEDVQFPSLNASSNLSGWYIPSSAGTAASRQTVVFSHGYGGNREEIWVPIYDLAKAAHDMGYNVLMFDYGYVQPQWNVTGGLRESQELLGAVKYAKDRGAEKVFVWGFSMGAGTALQAALQTKDIDGMILDSTFVLEPDTLYHNMKQAANLPKFSQSLVHMFFPLINGVSLNQVPYDKVKETQYSMPIFFIHGKKDLRAPYEMAEGIYQKQKADSGSELWLLENDGHELIYRAHSKSYLQMTTGFLHTLSSAPAQPLKYNKAR
ncbi:alpha/beta hydrolase [Paenibacillus elgii]|uniref:Alpha/beta hydrolase n=1 Tax=Paenibacillus elgii TaxID=189691 RepID=A0A161S639_9BACL|nr:alpha/beta fold hydrolase [Paenibacillus elgii]KZE74705.1 alpha/beta hydrolase [Paenibacillus elgii]NEN84562.1 alpha/beta fold hydrolase [Paenibacillus elgii]PUA35412.1 alpha/beta hydrolase [Paenibacillus elgii]